MKTQSGTVTKGHLLKLIRKYCLNCCGDQWSEVEKCPTIECEFHRFRFGTDRPKSPDDENGG